MKFPRLLLLLTVVLDPAIAQSSYFSNTSAAYTSPSHSSSAKIAGSGAYISESDYSNSFIFTGTSNAAASSSVIYRESGRVSASSGLLQVPNTIQKTTSSSASSLEPTLSSSDISNVPASSSLRFEHLSGSSATVSDNSSHISTRVSSDSFAERSISATVSSSADLSKNVTTSIAYSTVDGTLTDATESWRTITLSTEVCSHDSCTRSISTTTSYVSDIGSHSSSQIWSTESTSSPYRSSTINAQTSPTKLNNSTDLSSSSVSSEDSNNSTPTLILSSSYVSSLEVESTVIPGSTSEVSNTSGTTQSFRDTLSSTSFSSTTSTSSTTLSVLSEASSKISSTISGSSSSSEITLLNSTISGSSASFLSTWPITLASSTSIASVRGGSSYPSTSTLSDHVNISATGGSLSSRASDTGDTVLSSKNSFPMNSTLTSIAPKSQLSSTSDYIQAVNTSLTENPRVTGSSNGPRDIYSTINATSFSFAESWQTITLSTEVCSHDVCTKSFVTTTTKRNASSTTPENSVETSEVSHSEVSHGVASTSQTSTLALTKYPSTISPSPSHDSSTSNPSSSLTASLSSSFEANFSASLSASSIYFKITRTVSHVSTVTTTIDGTSTVYTTWCPLTLTSLASSELSTKSPTSTENSISLTDEEYFSGTSLEVQSPPLSSKYGYSSSPVSTTTDVLNSSSSMPVDVTSATPIPSSAYSSETTRLLSRITTVTTTINGTSTAYTTWCPLTESYSTSSTSPKQTVSTFGPSQSVNSVSSSHAAHSSVIGNTTQQNSESTGTFSTINDITTALTESWQVITLTTEVCSHTSCTRSILTTTKNKGNPGSAISSSSAATISEASVESAGPATSSSHKAIHQPSSSSTIFNSLTPSIITSSSIFSTSSSTTEASSTHTTGSSTKTTSKATSQTEDNPRSLISTLSTVSSDAIEYISTSQQSTEQTLSYVTESAHKAGTVSSDSKLSSTISTVVTTINGTSTVYTTWCPLTSDFETPSQSITGASSSPIEISSHTGDIPPTVSSASSTTISRPVSVPSSIVSTVVTTINGTSTVYTTWCPLTYESATPSPSVTGTSSNSDEISSHTEGTSEIASSISSETISQPVFNPSSVISTVVTTINGTSTVYTTWCPLSSEIKASSYVKSGSTSINTNPGPSTISSNIESTSPSTSPGPSTISSRIESTSKTLPSVISTITSKNVPGHTGIISTVVTLISGTSTSYTTWCPLSSTSNVYYPSLESESSATRISDSGNVESFTSFTPQVEVVTSIVHSWETKTLSTEVCSNRECSKFLVTTSNPITITRLSTAYYTSGTSDLNTVSPSSTRENSKSEGTISSYSTSFSKAKQQSSPTHSESISSPDTSPQPHNSNSFTASTVGSTSTTPLKTQEMRTISTIITTISGITTSYTTWCPLSDESSLHSFSTPNSSRTMETVVKTHTTQSSGETVSSISSKTTKPSVISETGQSVTLSEVGSTSSASVAGSSHTTPPTATLSYISSSAASTSIITSWKTVTISTEVCVDNACSQSAYVTTTPHAITLYSTIVSTNGWGNSSSQYARNSSSYISVATRPSASLNVSSLTVGTTRATANVSTIESTVNGTITTYTTWCPFSSINKTPAEVSGSLSTYSLTSTTTSVICPSCRAGNSNTSRTVPSTKTPAPSANGSTDDSSIVSSSSTSIDASSRTAETVFGSEVTRTMSSLGTTTISVQSCSEENCTTSRSSITSAALTTSPIEDYPSSTKYPSINKVASPSATSSATGHDTSSNSLQVFSAGVSKLVQSKALTIFGILVCLI
ncbi:FIG2 (YCR089W) and AGA1 (YNR044W) [Zygosaccharomyces parabailii]|nr:FIG2 (YCR089W) and AGA1 (YNR044W) [Zygosaccharomyces parabailii]